MKITSLSSQTRNPNRVNVSVNGRYRFSLDISQVVDLGIKVGSEYSEEEIASIENESRFGKLYARTLEYCLMRPHSAREVRDYLYAKTRPTRYKKGSGEIKEKDGYSKEIADRVLQRLEEKGYINDEAFARWWVENRRQRGGISLYKLRAELFAKGVAEAIITAALQDSSRDDKTELMKIIEKKKSRYDDPRKFKQYLVRQGFSYDMVNEALQDDEF